MPIVLTDEQKQAVEAAGYGITGSIGGLPKQTYWTPDGRMVKAFPNLRQYVRKDASGKVVSSGTRDANLDNGWLTTPPAVPKLHCPTCDKWHDTKKAVDACKAEHDRLFKVKEAEAKPEIENTEIKDLRNQVSELTKLVKQLAGGANGSLLQHGSNGGNKASDGKSKGNGSRKAVIQ